MNNRVSTSLVVGALIAAATTHVLAGPTTLPLRSESGTCIYAGGTTQTVETKFGKALATLPFASTTRYDFYSPQLLVAATLAASHKGGGTIFMRNTGTGPANDFKVTGRMRYFDYDPATGTESLIVDSGASPAQDVHHAQTAHWPLPNAVLKVGRTVPAGHLLHVSVEIALVKGNPAGIGWLLYNGASGSTTVGLLPQNDKPVQWVFAKPGTPSLSLCALPDRTGRLDGAGMPGQVYLIQAATNPASPKWTTLGTNRAGADGRFNFILSDMIDYPCRVYRLTIP